MILCVFRMMILVGMCVVSGGCNIIGWVVDSATPDTIYIREAQYKGLVGKRVAVMVNMDEFRLGRDAGTKRLLVEQLCRSFESEIKDIKLVSVDQVMAYDKAHDYWGSESCAKLMGDLGVERLIKIDVDEFEAKGRSAYASMKGRLSGQVSIGEVGEDGAESSYVFRVRVAVDYSPTGDVEAVVLGSGDAFERGLMSLFGLKVINLFRDIEVSKR